MPFKKIFSLCVYRHNTAFYYREKFDFWDTTYSDNLRIPKKSVHFTKEAGN